uniref:Secreted protein n=1 Tax=Ixodes scapularis TaxID=6945 RepID=A0A4D5REF8_IXOSC
MPEVLRSTFFCLLLLSVSSVSRTRKGKWGSFALASTEMHHFICQGFAIFIHFSYFGKKTKERCVQEVILPFFFLVKWKRPLFVIAIDHSLAFVVVSNFSILVVLMRLSGNWWGRT